MFFTFYDCWCLSFPRLYHLSLDKTTPSIISHFSQAQLFLPRSGFLCMSVCLCMCLKVWMFVWDGEGVYISITVHCSVISHKKVDKLCKKKKKKRENVSYLHFGVCEFCYKCLHIVNSECLYVYFYTTHEYMINLN